MPILYNGKSMLVEFVVGNINIAAEPPIKTNTHISS